MRPTTKKELTPRHVKFTSTAQRSAFLFFSLTLFTPAFGQKLSKNPWASFELSCLQGSVFVWTGLTAVVRTNIRIPLMTHDCLDLAQETQLVLFVMADGSSKRHKSSHESPPASVKCKTESISSASTAVPSSQAGCEWSTYWRCRCCCRYRCRCRYRCHCCCCCCRCRRRRRVALL